MRRSWNWTNKQRAKLGKVKAVLENLRNYWPLTLRQVYYQLVSQGVIENKTSEYNMLSQLLKHARLDGFISWDVIEDRVRNARLNWGWDDKIQFIEAERDYFLSTYRRHLQQGQANYIEFWVEKDAVSSIFQRAARPYCVPVCPCRGFSSVTFLHDLQERILSCQKNNQSPIILYFGDFDPSGDEMLPAMKITVEEEMGIKGIAWRRIALNKADIIRYRLPHNPKAVKKTDTRYKKFVERHGEYAVELDALPLNILEERVREAIESYIDMDQFNKQKSVADKEQEVVSALKKKAIKWIDSQDWG